MLPIDEEKLRRPNDIGLGAAPSSAGASSGGPSGPSRGITGTLKSAGKAAQRAGRAAFRREHGGILAAAQTGVDMFGPNRADYYLGATPTAYTGSRDAGMAAEQRLMNDLYAQSRGSMMGAGEAAYQRAANEANRRALSQAMSVDGVSPGAAASMAMQRGDTQRLQALEAAAQIGAQERQQAQQMLGGLASGAAGRGLAADQATAEMLSRYYQDRMGAASTIINPIAQAQIAEEQRKAGRDQAVIGGLFNAAGGAGAAAIMSDERLKASVNRESVASEADEFLALLDVASYEYIDPAHGEGRHYSAMAQSVAKSDLGKSFVVETPAGLALDVRRGFGAMLTVIKRLADRVEELENERSGS